MKHNIITDFILAATTATALFVTGSVADNHFSSDNSATNLGITHEATLNRGEDTEACRLLGLGCPDTASTNTDAPDTVDSHHRGSSRRLDDELLRLSSLGPTMMPM